MVDEKSYYTIVFLEIFVVLETLKALGLIEKNFFFVGQCNVKPNDVTGREQKYGDLNL